LENGKSGEISLASLQFVDFLTILIKE